LNVIPLGRWFRLEGTVAGSATVGQTSVSGYFGLQPAWDTVQSNAQATETNTSAAAANTFGSPDTYRFGCGQVAGNVSY
jgi:hypothetical protein